MAVVIASGFPGIAYPLGHPRIGWRRLAGTITASTSAAGYAAANAGTQRTDSFWQATALPATWAVDLGSAQPVSYCGIAAHDLGKKIVTVYLESSDDGVSWTTRATDVPADDGAIMFLLATVSARYWRIRLTGSNIPTIGVIQMGAVTEFPRLASYAPSLSFERAVNTTFSTNVTEGGSWAGRSIVRRSLSPSMRVANLSEAWIAAEWDAFAAAALTQAFFIADRPGSYPRSVAYAWTTADIAPDRERPNHLISNVVSLALVGFRG